MRPPTYVRFVTAKVDKNSGKRQGVFHQAYALAEAKEMHDYELEEWELLRKWFEKHLKVPARFSWSQRKHAAHKAISWYISSAKEYLRRMHAICRILNDHGINTEMITSARPGYIVFEDAHQIAAIPFSETAT